MADTTKSYRIRTDIGSKLTDDYITVDANLVQDYDAFDILSVSIDSIDTYKLHNSNYGVVVGRVLANNGFGIPNAKISIFISSDGDDGEKVRKLYPYTSSAGKDSDGVRYNLLPDEQVNDCHQVVGTFPNKRYALDNDVILEVFDKYYKYTTRTNNAGDYLIMGVPTGAQTIHMDLDLSDCGILSQRPRDFVYKGYTIEQFENANMFKDGTNYPTLSQIFTQDQVVNVRPFWGNSSLGEELGITRADIDVAFTFEPTCVFIGSVVSDNSSQGITKKCMGTENMGNMEELVTGEGTIEMIRMTPAGNVEEFQVRGTQLIDGDGVWCYQIPMNLDYMMTDEYGNMVPTDDPSKGVATRTRVRFRISMQDNEENVDNFFRPKVLVPHNPQNTEDGGHEDYDYEFGTFTRKDSFRDLFWNNVYSVKSYIPRFQKRKIMGWKDKRFVGIKNCNFYGTNNPIPYNNIRIRLPFMFTVMCAIIKTFIFVVGIINTMTSMFGNVLADIGNFNLNWLADIVQGICSAIAWIWGGNCNVDGLRYPLKSLYVHATSLKLSVLKEGLCPDLDNWYFAPMWRANLWVPSNQPTPPGLSTYNLLQQTLDSIMDTDAPNGSYIDDPTSIDYINRQEGEEAICLTTKTDYLISCIEMNLAMEYRVINFDFYNDWLNGTIYIPRFMRYVRPKKKFLGITVAKAKIKGCMDDPSIFSKTRRYTQQCALNFKPQAAGLRYSIYSGIKSPLGSKKKIKAANNYHKSAGFGQKTIFGVNGGIAHEQSTLKGDYVYYMKPCEWTQGTSPNNIKINFFATDIILLGSLNDCDQNGLPQAFRYLSSTSYVLPTNLALTNMEENGQLYATPGSGTICASGSTYVPANGNNGVAIEVVSQNEGISGELVYFSGTQASDIDLTYDPVELSDYIALTEAAGISWNFTGPNQGNADDARMYTPGGHFLGLSCVNSQTNIKSCINLSRICEVGANMSQRKEDVTSVTDSEGVSQLHYTYTAPSGFISGDDIMGEDFRGMFATMNMSRLIATKTNPDSGYKMYDFTFVKPVNFNGSFNNVATNAAPYNAEIPITISDEQVQQLRSVGIAVPGYDDTTFPDYDSAELNNTQIRTIENPSADYYAFRMGLKHSQLERGNINQLRKFLLVDNNEYYMPQYENSYYFYFGLNAGSTAIEKFNTQFFSTCESNTLLQSEASLILSVNEMNICNGTGSINVVANNMAVPYQMIVYYREGDNVLVKIDASNDDEGLLNRYTFTINNLSLGQYTFRIIDANDNEMESTINISDNLVSYMLETFDFNCNTQYSPNLNDDIRYRGGYIEVSNVIVKNLSSEAEIQLEIHSGPITDFTFESSSVTFMNDGNSLIRMPVSEGNVNKYLYATFKCEGTDENGRLYQKQSILLQIFSVKDTNSIKLGFGVNGVFEYLFNSSIHSVKDWWFSPVEYGNLMEDEKWVHRYSLFNEVSDNEKGTTTFSSNIICTDGTKVIWGTPQNSEGFFSGRIDHEGEPIYDTYSSEEYGEIPEGYLLDDSFSYYSTIWYEKQVNIPNDELNRPKHYSVLAYNGNLVYGDYYAKYSYDGVSSSIEFIGKGEEYFNNGYGFIFKPIPNGDIQFHILSYDENTSNKQNTLAMTYLDDNNLPYEEGILYPSFIVPVLHRPFYAETNFYIWQFRDYDDNEGNGTNRYMIDIEKCGRTEMYIHNGITSGESHNFGMDRSFITNFSATSILHASEDDFYNLNNRTNGDRILRIVGMSGHSVNGVSGITTAEYEIYGGCCENAQWSGYSYATAISDYVSFNFEDSFFGVLVTLVDEETSEEKKYISWELPERENSAEYYLCAQEDKPTPITGGSNSQLIRLGNIGAPEVSMGGKYYTAYYTVDKESVIGPASWKLGVYALGNDNKLYRLQIYLRRRLANNSDASLQYRYDLYYYVYDGSSSNIIFRETKRDYLIIRDIEEIIQGVEQETYEWQLNNLIERFPEYTPEPFPMVMNSGLTSDWKDIINRDKKRAEDTQYNNNYFYYIVGEQHSSTNSATTVYKIYPFFTIYDTNDIPPTDVQISITTLEYGYDETDAKIVSVSGSSYNLTNINSDSNWISIFPESEVGNFDVEINVDVSNSYEERTGVVNFVGEDGGNPAQLTVTQEGRPADVNIGPDFTNIAAEGGTTYFTVTSRGETEWNASVIDGAEWISIDPVNGNAPTTRINITVAVNETGDIRSGIIRITVPDKEGHPNRDFTITQFR